MRVALIHDWLNGMRGGEKVFEVLCELYPDADVYTLFFEPEKVSPIIRTMNVREWWLPRVMPGARRFYRWFLPILPHAVESLPVENYDLVISTSHCVAKGVAPDPPTTLHICYCFTPMRYVWDKYDDYFVRRRSLASWIMPLVRGGLQQWDRESAKRVTHFIAVSEFVRQRIREYYLREAMVLHPPVDWAKFALIERAPTDFYLVVSALEPYKRVDVAIEAFNRVGLPLKIVGTGTEAAHLQRLAGANIEFLGWVSDSDLAALYSCARALVFPAEEDFGIVPLEAMAAGCPVIALRRGGALETVVEFETGLFFEEQTPEALAETVTRFSRYEFDSEHLREHARQFDRSLFKQRFADLVHRLLRYGSSDRLTAVSPPPQH